MLKRLVIATRGSKLALWQAEHIQSRLLERYPGMVVEFVIIKTTGDKIQDVPLARIGGKGLFVKEIEEALLDGRADLAVHSMKDVPAELPEGLKLGVIPQRGLPYDLLLTNEFAGLQDLPPGARVGTSSLRRKIQLLHLRPDLEILTLRGNLDTRVRKLKNKEYEAIVAAAAGMERLCLEAPQKMTLEPPQFYPAVGQGALGIEYAEDRPEIEELLGFMDHAPTRFCVQAERAFLHHLEGGCQVPIAGHAQIVDSNRVRLTGLVGDLKGENIVMRSGTAKTKDVHSLGIEVAQEVLDGGGQSILEEVYGELDQ